MRSEGSATNLAVEKATGEEEEEEEQRNALSARTSRVAVGS